MSKFKIAASIVAVVAIFAGYNVSKSQTVMTVPDLTLAGIEAQASCEVSATRPNEGGCSQDISTNKEYCVKGGWGPKCCGTF